MDRMNLREAARRTMRSVTTLRRYIKSGRLESQIIPGRYGPEYIVTEKNLLDAGFNIEDLGNRPSANLPVKYPEQTKPVGFGQETVPLALYQELQMKHEQLLVQYGMFRASGLRVMELRNEIEQNRRQIDEYTREISRLKARLESDARKARRERQELELELKGRSLETAALMEKVKGLEMLMRNAVTNESIEQQFSALMNQTTRVGRKTAAGPRPGRLTDRSWQGPRDKAPERDH